MLQLKPTCEHCDSSLPPESVDARICSYECTFCVSCVDNILLNVCPNCGGGFERRPIRPKNEWVQDVSLTTQAATVKKTFKPVNPEQHAQFARKIASVSAQNR